MPKKTWRDYPKVQFYPGELAAPLAAREKNGASLSEIAKRDLSRYYTLLTRELPTFTAPEAALIVDVLNGTLIDASIAPYLWQEIADALGDPALLDKWNEWADEHQHPSITPDALIARLRKLTPFQAMAVGDASERYWAHIDTDPSVDEGLRAVGLTTVKYSA